MPRPPEGIHATRWRSKASTCKSTIVRRYPRGRADGVKGNGVRRSFQLRGLTLWYHLRELEITSEGRGDGYADETAGVLDHEGHFFGRHVFRGDDEVSFVFARGGVHDYDEITAFFKREDRVNQWTPFLVFADRSGRKSWELARRTESFYRILHRIQGQV